MEENQRTAKVEKEQYIVVKFGEEQFGINIQYVHNIVRMQRMTRIPKAPVYIKGVINLRGEIIPVMSLRSKFDLPDDEYTNKTRIIIVKIDPEFPLGLLVDEVREVVQLDEGSIEKRAFDTKDTNGNYLVGIGKSNGELISLLSLTEILNEKENI
ncbi:MAG: CheW protein [Clostridiales bacterium]|jgi:purine-binding chemotaxis protein CheW|nr:CheW protein [Clostridiales bacterium]